MFRSPMHIFQTWYPLVTNRVAERADLCKSGGLGGQNNFLGPVVSGKVGWVGCQETDVSHHPTLSSLPYLHGPIFDIIMFENLKEVCL